MINNLEAYKVFYYVAKCGSVTKAAGELSISQPAVSQAIKQLENTLDAALFHRAAKGVRLTSEGELLYSYVAKGYEQIEMGVKKVHQMQNMELGEVRIGASDMTLQFYLLPYLEKFHEQYPGIKVNFYDLGINEMLEKFSREYEAGIHTADILQLKEQTGSISREYIQQGLLHRLRGGDAGITQGIVIYVLRAYFRRTAQTVGEQLTDHGGGAAQLLTCRIDHGFSSFS